MRVFISNQHLKFQFEIVNEFCYPPVTVIVVFNIPSCS